MKECKNCQSSFTITNEDRAFYQKMEVPEPMLCPDCRQQRRLSWRNEHNLFRRNCDLCHQKTFSAYPEKTAFPVYCLNCWWGDNWDPLSYGQEFDFSQSFFDQFYELQQKVPRMALMQSRNENSEYTNCVSHLKDCYLLFSADFNQDCLYGVWIEKSKNCIDNLMIDSCQLTYESIFSQNIHNSKFILHSSQCSDSAFLLDCRNCSHCLMCYGLRNKEYYIANKAYSKEEYFEKIKEFPLSSHANLEQAKKHFFELVKNAKNPHIRKKGTLIHSSGDFLVNTENCLECYDLTEAKDCKYIVGGFELKDAQDCCYVNGELGYENCECVPMPHKSISCVNSYTGAELTYCDLCMNNCKDCFGCIGLKHKEYCILNKQYSKQEYEKLKKQMVEEMKKLGDYGEFFPMKYSPFPYNISEAFQIYPLAKEQVLSKGMQWKEKDQRQYQPNNYVIPDAIKEVKQEIIDETLSCKDCSKNYKITSHELSFYRQLELPIPRKCFNCRHQNRLSFKNPRKLWKRECDQCQKEIETTYSSEQLEKVLCEHCYLKNVY